ncbi:hypothetical protein ETB97_011485 [Aspergillus alliaceus]|uniref:Uncharacterized protein n=1 Tax=Petromyces alliaceus TaxID=209559 RepID=A0A8H6A8Q0_PETAA|nr:hypothetical protein ETB97_011485 [Aspergillus burnettii]
MTAIIQGRSNVIDRTNAAIARIKALYAHASGVSFPKLGSFHGPVNPSTDVSLPSIFRDGLLIEACEATACPNPIGNGSFSGPVIDMTPSMSESNISEDQHVLFAQLREPTKTTMQDWLLKEDDPETLRSLHASLGQEFQELNPTHGANSAQTLGPYSAFDLQDIELDFIPSSNYLQVHNYSADARSSDMDDIALDNNESLAAATKLKQTVEGPQQPVTASQSLNNRLLNSAQHNKCDCSYISEGDQIITPAAGNSMQNIPYPNHACYCWRELTDILEKIELKDNTLETLEQSSVELALSFQRRAVEKCTAMIACNYCRSSSERMMLLGLIVHKLVMKFGDLIRVCQGKGIFQALPDPHPSSSNDQAAWSLIRSQVSASSSNIYFPNTTNMERRLFLGDYEVRSAEWAPLMKTLITLYAEKLESLLSCCKTWATAANQSAMLAMFSNVEEQFKIISAIL